MSNLFFNKEVKRSLVPWIPKLSGAEYTHILKALFFKIVSQNKVNSWNMRRRLSPH